LKFEKKILPLLVLGLTGSLLATESSKPKVAENKKGALLFETCKTCHGEKGEGNIDIQAPSINGLPEWYLISTLTKFKDGVRGAHPDDLRGLNMRPIARALKGKEEIKAVAKYVESLNHVPPKTTLHGDAEKGKALYAATCTACHGPEGKGNPDPNIKAPPIATLPDWFIVNQLEKFKSGVRGAHSKDKEGAQMRPMAQALADRQAMVDLAAHINSLDVSDGNEGTGISTGTNTGISTGASTATGTGASTGTSAGTGASTGKAEQH